MVSIFEHFNNICINFLYKLVHVSFLFFYVRVFLSRYEMFFCFFG